MRIRLLCVLLLFPFSLLLAQPSFFPEELIVSASALNLREKPDKASKSLEKLTRGAALQFIEAANDGEYEEVDSTYGIWLKVRSKNKTGYVFSPHVVGNMNLYFEGDFLEDPLPPLQWYGVYQRDSFADEVRKIEVRLAEEYNEMYGETIKVLKTNQKETSKFILATVNPQKTGYVGPLGVFDPGSMYSYNSLFPGAMMPIHPGQEDTDTTNVPTYFLSAVGCASFDDEGTVQVRDYHLYCHEYNQPPTPRQDLTSWLIPAEGANPNISLYWYGDLDHDRKADMILQDSPDEAGSRLSLFLSSKARPGEYLHKVCEYHFPGD